MAYTKTKWVDRSVQYPSRFTRTTDGTYDTLIPAPGAITIPGTPITAAALNNLETQFDQATTLEDWKNVTFENNYAAYGSNYGYPGFRKKPDGEVVLRGAIRSVGILEPAVMFTLPVNYRPLWDMAFASVDNNSNHCTIIIRISGSVTIVVSTGYDVRTEFISLDGIRFDTK